MSFCCPINTHSTAVNINRREPSCEHALLQPPRPYKGTPDSERAAPNEIAMKKTFVDIILR